MKLTFVLFSFMLISPVFSGGIDFFGPRIAQQERELLRERRKARTDEELEEIEERLRSLLMSHEDKVDWISRDTGSFSFKSGFSVPGVWMAPKASSASNNEGRGNADEVESTERQVRFKDPETGRMVVGTRADYEASLLPQKCKKNADGSVSVEDLGTYYPSGKFVYTEKRGTFTGKFKAYRPQGLGKLEDRHGNIFNGQFDKGIPVAGELIHPNGDRYQGEVTPSLHRHGNGTFILQDGRKIEGLFDSGKISRGKISYPKRGVYEGPIVNNHAHGSGVIVIDGIQINGEFILGQLIKGKFQTPNGESYEGSFENDLPHGEGILIKNGLIYRGVLEKGVFKKGQIRTPNGRLYEGSVNKNLAPQGFGKVICVQSGIVVTGHFNDSHISKGVIELSNGSRYEGSLNDDLQMHGQGILVNRNGQIQEGIFNKNSFQSGTVKFSNGDSSQGTWQEGFLEGDGIYRSPGNLEFMGSFRRAVPIHGVVSYPDGRRYTGTVNQNYEPEGRGEMFFPEKGTYRGWFGGHPAPEGEPVARFDFEGGTVNYVGELVNYLPHGRGTILQDGITILEAQFEDGYPIQIFSVKQDLIVTIGANGRLEIFMKEPKR
jgi:hypothetical protein